MPEHKLGVFECAVSDSDAQVLWFFNGQQVDKMQTKKRFQLLSIGEFRRLAIRNCLMHESGTLVACKWGDLETSGKLFVIDCPIIFKEGLKNQKVPKHANVAMECKITNNLAPTVLTFKWKKNGEPLDIDANKDKYEFVIDGDKYCLNVKDFGEKDVAEYEIYLTDPDDFDVSSKAKVELDMLGDHEEIIEDTTISTEVIETESTLEDIEKKQKFVYKLNDCHVRKHDQGEFELKLPNSKTKVKWLKDGVPISSSSKYEIEVSIYFLFFYFL